MLTNPLSPLVRHRLFHDRLSTPEARRLAQIRPRTASGVAEFNDVDAPCRLCAVAGRIATAVRTERPAHDATIDQCHVDAASLARRLTAICASRPIRHTRLAFVGDDDLASVALMRMAPPAAILLLDIDDRIVRAFRAEAERRGLSDRATAVQVDLTCVDDVRRVLDTHGDSYEVVVTDPPYAHDGMLHFIEVAAALTAFGGEIHAAVPSLLAEAWTDELLHAVQARLCAHGFVIDRVQPGAFTYETSDVISSLVVARRLPGAPPVSLSRPATSRFYTTRTIPAQRHLTTTTEGADKR